MLRWNRASECIYSDSVIVGSFKTDLAGMWSKIAKLRLVLEFEESVVEFHPQMDVCFRVGFI